MITRIHFNNLDIFTNQIICAEIFKELYAREKPITFFNARINKAQNRYGSHILADERNKTQINKGSFVILRVIKGNKKFEFISKIGEGGRFSIPQQAIQILELHEGEITFFEVIAKKDKSDVKIEKAIDLADIKENSSIIFREKSSITIVKGGTIPITLPRFIHISAELIELCFLIHGDGHYNTKLFFVNKKAELIEFVIAKFEEILNIPRELWRARVLFNNSADADLAKKMWKDKLKLKDEQFYPSISKCILNTSAYGNLRIVIDKLIVASLFRHIFNTLQDNLKHINSLYALNGLLCAEGSAERSKRGLHKITINFSLKEKELFTNILYEAKILSLLKDKGDRFLIEGWINCYKLFKVFFENKIVPFNLHNDRCKNALSGFLDHSFTRSMDKYLSLFNKKEVMNTNELIEITNHFGNSIINLLRKKQYRPFIKLEGREFHKRPYLFFITTEGKEFLTLIKAIREEYNERFKLQENTKTEADIGTLKV